MHRSGIDQIRPGKLANPAQRLKRGLRYDLPLPVVQGYEPVNGAANLVVSMRVGHAHAPFCRGGPIMLCSRYMADGAASMDGRCVGRHCKSPMEVGD